MKRLIYAALIALVAVATLAHPAQATLALKPCSVYELNSYLDAGYHTDINVGNFSAVTTYSDPLGKNGGQTNWVELGAAEVAYIQAVNDASLKPWSWAAGTTGQIYVGDEDVVPIKWPRIVLGSSEDPIQPKNEACVLERSTDGRFARLQGIPKSADYLPYGAYPWLFNTVFVVYPAPDGSPNRTGGTPLYRMPLWDPASGFKTSLGGTGIWVSVKFLGKKLGEWSPVAATPSPTTAPTIVPTPTSTPQAIIRIPAYTVVRQYPDGPKIYKTSASFTAPILASIRSWVQIAYQRWVDTSLFP